MRTLCQASPGDDQGPSPEGLDRPNSAVSPSGEVSES